MIYKANVEQLVNKAAEIRIEMRNMVVEILTQLGATNKKNAVIFDGIGRQAPSFFSINCAAEADGMDVYIQELWLDGKGLKATYYIPSPSFIGGDFEHNMSIDDESCVDYEDILDWLKDKLD